MNTNMDNKDSKDSKDNDNNKLQQQATTAAQICHAPSTTTVHRVYEVLSADLARYTNNTPGTWTFSEELNFRNDSGYDDVQSLFLRAAASIERAFGINRGHQAPGRFQLGTDTCPLFSTKNRLRITVELIRPDADTVS